MRDQIFEGWLKCQLEEALALAGSSDLVNLVPENGAYPRKYVIEFRCNGLIRQGSDVVEANRFITGVWFPPNYHRRVNPYQVVTLLEPANLWHPNYDLERRVICIGPIPPGTSLTSIIYQLFEVFSYQRVTMREDDALNWAACAWARRNIGRFPIDSRPLKRRELAVEMENPEGAP